MSDPLPAASCTVARPTPRQRLALCFALLFALKWALGATALAPTPRALLLATGATVVVGALWARRGASWRVPLLLSGSLWLATLAKLALH